MQNNEHRNVINYIFIILTIIYKITAQVELQNSTNKNDYDNNKNYDPLIIEDNQIVQANEEIINKLDSDINENINDNNNDNSDKYDNNNNHENQSVTIVKPINGDNISRDLLMKKIKKKQKEVAVESIDNYDFLKKIDVTTETTNLVNITTAITTTSDDTESTSQSSFTEHSTIAVPTLPSLTEKPPVEESVIFNYTFCEDLHSEDFKRDRINFSNNLGIKSIFSSLNVSQDKNFTVEDLIVKQSNDTSLTISWKAKDNYETQWYIIEWYQVKENKLHGSCRTNNETFNYTISHLDTCTTWEIHVLPATNTTLGHQKLVKETTALSVDNNSLNLKASDRGSYWIKITWQLTYSDCIEKSKIDCCNYNNCQSNDVTLTSYNVTNLIPCTDYNITLTIIQKNGVSQSTHTNGSTEFMKPGVPSPAWTEAGNKSLIIDWALPISSTCISIYSVKIVRQNEPSDSVIKNTTETSIVFYGLESCSIYNITITPIDTQNNYSEPALINSNRTLAPVPESPIFKLSKITSRSIIITWSLSLNESNNCEDIQVIANCNFVKVLGHGYEGTNGTVSINITQQISKKIIDTEILNLSPYTKYNCSSVALNSRGNSSNSHIQYLQTREDVPSSPTLAVYNITDTHFVLSWDPPKYLPGYLMKFEINFTWYYKFHQPSWCGNLSYITENINDIDGDQSSLSYTKATPYSVYKATIKAKTSAGWGNYSEDTEFTTLPGAPGPVSDLTFVLIKNRSDPNILDGFLSWGLPCFKHGPKIDLYNITGVGHRKSFDYHTFTEITPAICQDDICRKKLPLKDEYSYVFEIAGKVKDFKDFGQIKSINASFPAGIPPKPSINYTNQITIDPFKARRTTNTASILLPLFPNVNGDIICYAVMVARAGYNNASSSRIDRNPEDWLDVASWDESRRQDFKIPYQAIKFCDNTYNSYVVDFGKLKAIKLIIGEDLDTCEELSSKKTERSYCNGRLNPDTWYDVRLRAFTSGGYRDSQIFIIRTNAEMQVALLIGTVLGILILGILITMMLLIRNISLQAVMRRFLHSDMPGSPVPAPFNRRKFIAHCQQLADNPGKLSNEFQLLQTLSVDLQMPTNAACLQANRKKNRYTDILPYDFSRVKLEIVDNDPNTDYINASFIKGFSGEEEYIACQGTKEETTFDFWRMIDQYNIKLIVMLTQLVEKNKEKCHQYYPTIRETFTYENLSIRCSSELDYRTYTQRTLILQKDNEKRIITHLHFKDWPDHDVPEDCDPMITFCQIMRRNIGANRGLAVIHCSAGIGRTGTLIAIDILLQHIKENRKLDVFGTVYRLRHHRINMVQKESQYAYIYNCIKQVLKNPYFSKNYKPPSVEPISDSNLNNKKKDNSMTNLVSSLETLKKDSISLSIQSAEEILKSTSSILSSSSPSASSSSSTNRNNNNKNNNNSNNNKMKNCLLSFKGFKYSKSMSAIHINSTDNQIVRYHTLNYPVNKISNLNEDESLTSSLTRSSSSSSLVELNSDNLNMNDIPALNRYFKSTSGINSDPSTATQRLLDTSL